MSHLIHIGLHKTGTTSLQAFLRDHEQLLDEHGWAFPNGLLQLNCHFELGLALLRLDRITPCRMRGLDWQSALWRRDTIEQVSEYLDRHPRTILSCEELSLFRYPRELAALKNVVGDDAEIVVYLRDHVDWLESMRDEIGQYAELSDDPESFFYLEPDSWQLDYETRVHEWLEFFPNVQVIDYELEMKAEGTIIPSFCGLLEIEPPADYGEYLLNQRGSKWDGRVPGTRWSGGRFGDPVRPTTRWQSEFLRRRGLAA